MVYGIPKHMFDFCHIVFGKIIVYAKVSYILAFYPKTLSTYHEQKSNCIYNNKNQIVYI